VHNLHSEFSKLNVVLLVIFKNAAANNSLNFAERALTNTFEYLELINEFLVVNNFDLNFVGEIHTVGLFKELFVCQTHICRCLNHVLELRFHFYSSLIKI